MMSLKCVNFCSSMDLVIGSAVWHAVEYAWEIQKLAPCQNPKIFFPPVACVAQAGFDFLDLEVVLPSISLLGVGLELGNY